MRPPPCGRQRPPHGLGIPTWWVLELDGTTLQSRLHAWQVADQDPHSPKLSCQRSAVHCMLRMQLKKCCAISRALTSSSRDTPDPHLLLTAKGVLSAPCSSSQVWRTVVDSDRGPGRLTSPSCRLYCSGSAPSSRRSREVPPGAGCRAPPAVIAGGLPAGGRRARAAFGACTQWCSSTQVTSAAWIRRQAGTPPIQAECTIPALRNTPAHAHHSRCCCDGGVDPC